jgi:hypothetical protein
MLYVVCGYWLMLMWKAVILQYIFFIYIKNHKISTKLMILPHFTLFYFTDFNLILLIFKFLK